ncbi:MAG: hypothetical protein NTY66_01645 [Candidatus Vogelbacteria bacterium]|nr:hypothetical protein [Candidatus Vogelbacteria bacterium]
MTKLILKNRAIELRKNGCSYTDIKRELNVSKSTLTLWLRSVPYKPNEIVLKRFEHARELSSLARTRIRIESETNALIAAEKDVGGKMSERELFFLGLGLYMGEGSKTPMVRVVNSDLEVVKLAIIWLKKVYGLRNSNISIRIHLYPDSDIEKCLDYWAKNTGIPRSQFHKTSIDRRTGKMKNHQGKLPYGTAHLTAKCCGDKSLGVFLHRRILSSIKVATDKAGIV